MSIFETVSFKKPQESRFNLSHDIVTSFKMGQLIPTGVIECLPGDRFTIGVENMLRFAPLVTPIMHRVDVETHYFFVPNRILYAEWERFIAGQTDALHPTVSAVDLPLGSLGDYMGVPASQPVELAVNPMPFAAYLKIFDDYYRDQNLQDERFIPLVSGDNPLYVGIIESDPLRRSWGRDYFTSALPFAQKGDAVQIPLVTDDVQVQYRFRPGGPLNNVGQWRDSDTGLVDTFGSAQNIAGPSPLAGSARIDGNPSAYDPNGTLVAPIQSEATDINTLRRAFRLQEWLEKNARAGTRYLEQLMVHWGVKSSDARLQRSEYIGGAKQRMSISEVLATAENETVGVPVGNMAGHGVSVGGGNTFNYRCEEHGFIIGIMSVRPKTKYQDGLHKLFTRSTLLDYAFPTFANIGEQEIKNSEVYVQHPDPNGTFGYIPRYAEYKYINSRVSSQMRGPLAFWHLGRTFATAPVLNEDFIECNPDTRIFAVTDPGEDHIFANIYNNIYVTRKLPKFGTPSI